MGLYFNDANLPRQAALLTCKVRWQKPHWADTGVMPWIWNLFPDMESPAQYVRVSDLLLDIRNPRRTSRDVQKTQEELLKEMYKTVRP